MSFVVDIYALCNIMNFKGNKDPQDVSLRSLIFPWSKTLSRDSNINWGKWIPTRIFPSQITHVDLFVYLCNVDIYFDVGICKLGNKFSKMLEDYCWCCFINCCKYFGFFISIIHLSHIHLCILIFCSVSQYGKLLVSI